MQTITTLGRTTAAGLLFLGMAATADSVNWQGTNTKALDDYARANWLDAVTGGFWWKAGYGPAIIDTAALAASATVESHNLWSNGSVPGPNDTARFVWSDNRAFAVLTNGAGRAVERDVVIDGSFSPGHLYHWSQSAYVSLSDILIRKNLEVQTLYYESGWTSSTKGQIFLDAGYALTLTGGPRPFTFAGYRGGWGGIVLGTGSTLAFTGADITFDSFHTYANSSLAGTDGLLVFSNRTATITLGQPPVGGLYHAIGVGGNQLRVHRHQTWLNPSGAGIVYIAPADEDTLVQSTDGGALTNLAAVAFRFNALELNGSDFYVLPGVYRGFSLTSFIHYSSRLNYYRLAGDVALAGGAVLYDAAVSNAAHECAYGLYFEPNSRYSGSEVHLAGHTLTLDRGVKMHNTRTDIVDASMATGPLSVDAAGSVLTIGGDLVYEDAVFYAGHTNSAGVLVETRRMGVIGDASTVVNLHGDFVSNTRSPTRGSGLYRSTVNLIGGTPEAPNTFERACDPANAVADDTYALGVLNVGTSATATAHVKLVNNATNDGDPANPLKTGAGEIVLVGSLGIAPGSTLDLNTGAPLADGDVVPVIAAAGNQAAAWTVFRDCVIDSANPRMGFEPVYDAGADRTRWAAAQPSGGTLLLLR